MTEAIAANSKLIAVYIQDNKDQRFLTMLDERKLKYEIVDKKQMDSLFGSNHQGYGAYREDYHIFGEELLDEIKGETKRLLVLDGIQDPHNLGAIIRSVDAFGFDGIVLPKNRSCSVNETVAHVSTGAIEHVKIAYVNSLPTFINRLKDKGYWICGTDALGTVELDAVDKDRNLAIIIGSEGFGMSKTLVKMVDYLVAIPMVGHVNSLNASVSTGIVLYSLRKNKS